MTIFVSHSQRDKEHLAFLNQAFSTTPNVDAKYEEIEAIDGDPRTADRISRDIQDSEAVFVLLTENVSKLEHTRDWVAWEAGVGAGKGVWVFECQHEHSKIVIPKIDHYVAFRHAPAWVAYLRGQLKLIERTQFSSLDKGGSPLAFLNPPKSVVRTASSKFLEIMMGSKFIDALKTIRRKRQLDEYGHRGDIRSVPFKCSECEREYLVHREIISVIRCPVCNALKSFSEWN